MSSTVVFVSADDSADTAATFIASRSPARLVAPSFGKMRYRWVLTVRGDKAVVHDERTRQDMTAGPTPFKVHQPGTLLHGTKADLAVGDLLRPGHLSNFAAGRIMNHVYVTATLDAAVWGAELALGEGPGHIYIVQPTGTLEDDPNVTDKKFPGNPTRSYRTRQPVRIVGELTAWTGHTPDQLRTMKDRLADLNRRGLATIED